MNNSSERNSNETAILCICQQEKYFLWDNAWISLAWNFRNAFDLNDAKLKAFVWGDSSNGVEVVQDEKHLAAIIRGYGWYRGCSGIDIDSAVDAEFLLNVSRDLKKVFSQGVGVGLPDIPITQLSIGKYGIVFHLKVSQEPDPTFLKAFKETETGMALIAYFQRIVKREADLLMMSMSHFLDIEWADPIFVNRKSRNKDDAHALTKLLKIFDSPISAVKANKLLMAHGFLEERERPSALDPSKTKQFKVLTEKGLAFGYNKENPRNEIETTPHFYVDTFEDLLRAIGIVETQQLLPPQTILREGELKQYLNPQRITYYEAWYDLKHLSKMKISEKFLELLRQWHPAIHDSEEISKEALPAAEAFFLNGADINCFNEEGVTPLMRAIGTGCLNLVKWCLARRADVNQSTKSKHTPLMMACGTTNVIHWELTPETVAIAKHLIKMGANPKSVTQRLRSALAIAKTAKNKEMVRYLRIHLKSTENGKALSFKEAVFLEHEERVAQLLAEGQEPDKIEVEGLPALVFAVTRFDPNLRIIKSLVAGGADLDKTYHRLKESETNGNTILHFAAPTRNPDLFAFIISQSKVEVNQKNYSGLTALQLAVLKRSDPFIIKALLEKGANINASDNFGMTALHLAMRDHGRMDTVQLLLAKGADVNLKDAKGETPAFSLFQTYEITDENKLEYLNLLIEAGADLEVQNHQGANLFWKVSGLLKCEKRLKTLGLAVKMPRELKPQEILMVLYRALKQRNEGTFAHYLATIDTLPQQEGAELLHACIQAEQDDMARALIRKKANTNTKISGQNAYEFAEKLGMDELVKFMAEYESGVSGYRKQLYDECRAFYEIYTQVVKSAQSIDALDSYYAIGIAFQGEEKYKASALRLRQSVYANSVLERLEMAGKAAVKMIRREPSGLYAEISFTKETGVWKIGKEHVG